MTPLESALLQMQETVDSFQQGTPKQPKDGTTEWYMLRVASLGLSYLKRLQLLDVAGDPAACERLYLEGNKHFKSAVPPPAPSREVE